jgi:hypothetical protein
MSPYPHPHSRCTSPTDSHGALIRPLKVGRLRIDPFRGVVGLSNHIGFYEKHTSLHDHCIPTNIRYRLSRAEERAVVRDRTTTDMNRRATSCGVRQYVYLRFMGSEGSQRRKEARDENAAPRNTHHQQLFPCNKVCPAIQVLSTWHIILEANITRAAVVHRASECKFVAVFPHSISQLSSLNPRYESITTIYLSLLLFNFLATSLRILS